MDPCAPAAARDVLQQHLRIGNMVRRVVHSKSWRGRLGMAGLATALMASGASGQTTAPKPPADPPAHRVQSPANPIDAIMRGLNLKAEPGEPADFVKRSRPAGELEYVPVGGPRNEPSGQLLTADQIKAREAELDAVRRRDSRITHRPMGKDIYRSAAAKPDKPAKKKKKVNCLLTCTVTLTR